MQANQIADGPLTMDEKQAIEKAHEELQEEKRQKQLEQDPRYRNYMGLDKKKANVPEQQNNTNEKLVYHTLPIVPIELDLNEYNIDFDLLDVAFDEIEQLSTVAPVGKANALTNEVINSSIWAKYRDLLSSNEGLDFFISDLIESIRAQIIYIKEMTADGHYKKHEGFISTILTIPELNLELTIQGLLNLGSLNQVQASIKVPEIQKDSNIIKCLQMSIPGGHKSFEIGRLEFKYT